MAKGGFAFPSDSPYPMRRGLGRMGQNAKTARPSRRRRDQPGVYGPFVRSSVAPENCAMDKSVIRTSRKTSRPRRRFTRVTTLLPR